MSETFDFVVIGSGFGGSVSALRLTEKGYSVLVLERGRRFAPGDFAESTWRLRRYLWAPALGCFGILEVSAFRDLVVLHGSGVGGGSLGYAGVLIEPDDASFDAPAWTRPLDWKLELRPHYATAKRMLGVAPNPRATPADDALRAVAVDLGRQGSWSPTPVGIFFGEQGGEGNEVPDPYFGGAGPRRRACSHCGACMVGCRHDAKNTLDRNYLWLAEAGGARVAPESEVRDVRPLVGAQSDGARFEVRHRRTVRARGVIVAAGVLGTLRLLLRCRDVVGSLPNLSRRLGTDVRTNSDSLLGAIARRGGVDYSKGVAITSAFRADPVTTVEPVRYPAGSSLMRFMGSPLVEPGPFALRLARSIGSLVLHPVDGLRAFALPGWAERTTILLAMQTVDEAIRMELGRGPSTLFRRKLVSRRDGPRRAVFSSGIAHEVARRFAEKTGAMPFGSVHEGILGIPLTAHILGGCPIGLDAHEGVVGPDFQVHGYPGLYVVDGSIVPANPGVNPSLTIAALAEYAMSRVPDKR